MERTSAKGEPPSVVTTRELAEKVTELYWPQADAFGVGVVPRLLRPMVMRSWTAMVARLNELEERDHFIPWSRYPDDGLDSFVLAERGALAEAVA